MELRAIVLGRYLGNMRLSTCTYFKTTRELSEALSFGLTCVSALGEAG